MTTFATAKRFSEARLRHLVESEFEDYAHVLDALQTYKTCGLEGELVQINDTQSHPDLRGLYFMVNAVHDERGCGGGLFPFLQADEVRDTLNTIVVADRRKVFLSLENLHSFYVVVREANAGETSWARDLGLDHDLMVFLGPEAVRENFAGLSAELLGVVARPLSASEVLSALESVRQELVLHNDPKPLDCSLKLKRTVH